MATRCSVCKRLVHASLTCQVNYEKVCTDCQVQAGQLAVLVEEGETVIREVVIPPREASDQLTLGYAE
jgi:hypothetical protein